MGTNYYWHSGEVCPHCGRSDEEELHIGKSSAGWCFALHAYPETGPYNLGQWTDRFMLEWSAIRDEYGRAIAPSEMLRIIMLRGGEHHRHTKSEEWLSQNCAVPGPWHLARHALDGHRIVHGEGTWDLIVGEFS